jgi:uncharacterized protein YaaN involved in tellurite resistance
MQNSTKDKNERTENAIVAENAVDTDNALNAISELPIQTVAQEVIPLNYEAALASFPEAEQEEILALADCIDVRKVDNVLNYGAVPLKQTFDSCGSFLKDERGSQADQEVIEQVIKLSKKANESYEDFNLVLKEPNFLQKMVLKLSRSKRIDRTKKIQHSAVTNYGLLLELQKSFESWLEILQKAMGDISESAMSDTESAEILDKYIIAGKIAEARVKKELDEMDKKYHETGLQSLSKQYDELKEGYDIFVIKLDNLEKSRAMYQLSIGQLALIKRSNRNVQIVIHTQKDNSMALMGQQLRNALLNEKNREILEGKKDIKRLNEELIKKVSQNVTLTAEESEKLIYAGFYDITAAKEAVQAVISSCNVIEKTAEEMLPKMKADMTELNKLMEELEPHVESVKIKTLEENNTPPTVGNAKLNF